MQMSTSTNHGAWSSISSINPVNDTGSGTGNYTFSNESSITLGLTNGFIEALNINLLSGSITENTGSAAVCLAADYTFGTTCDSNLTFLEAGFLLTAPNHLAETSQTLSIKAVKKLDNSLSCTPAFASTSKSITFTCAYNNPTTGTLPIRINSNALNSSNNTSASCDTTGRTMSLAFDATGSATASLQYADVGNMTLNAKYLANGLNMTGTNTFIAAPASFGFSAVTAAPIKAGNNFSATVTAKNAAGAATPNFAKENVAEGINLAFTKCQPTGTASVNGSFSGAVGAFTNGVATSSSLKWTEVGNGDLSATLTSANYLGSGLSATGNTGTGGTTCNGSGNVGRFVPDHFNTVVTQGCNTGNFTYSAQPFSVQTTALNASGAVTQNYDGSSNTSPNFAKTTSLSDANAATVGTLTNTAIASSAFSAGLATTSPSYTFTSKLTSPTTIKLRAIDTDNSSSSSGTEGTAVIRSGRLFLQNSYGSELLNLSVPLEAQYWNGSAYVRNQQDSCTTIPASSIAMGNYRNNLAACETQLGYSSGSGVLISGASKSLRLSKPGSGNNGTVDLTLNLSSASGSTCSSATATAATSANIPWFGTNPVSRATFGIYKTPIIYMRENFY
jgi:MSHA biogenesis protein MshQ